MSPCHRVRPRRPRVEDSTLGRTPRISSSVIGLPFVKPETPGTSETVLMSRDSNKFLSGTDVHLLTRTYTTLLLPVTSMCLETEHYFTTRQLQKLVNFYIFGKNRVPGTFSPVVWDTPDVRHQTSRDRNLLAFRPTTPSTRRPSFRRSPPSLSSHPDPSVEVDTP